METSSIAVPYCCVPCQTPMRPRRNDVMVHLTMQDDQPYQIWNGDVWECPKCEARIVTGFGNTAVAEHWQERFARWLERVDITIHGKLLRLKGESRD